MSVRAHRLGRNLKALLLSCGAPGLVVFSTQVHAQGAPIAAKKNTPIHRAVTPKKKPASGSSGIEEVTVTASRRSSSAANLAEAVDVISSKTIKNFNITSLQDIAKIDPSLSIQSYGGAQQNLIMRGVASTVGQTTGIYLDETPLLGGYSTNIRGDGTPGLRLHDIQRIEVLKGPQGTLFGAMSMAGTLRAIANKPDLNKYSGFVNANAANQVGGDAYFDGDVGVNIPVVKNRFAVRLVGWGEQGGGFVTWKGLDQTKHNVNDEHMVGGRIIGKLRVTDNFDITASLNYQKTSIDGTQNFLQSAGAYNAPFKTNEIYKDEYKVYNVTGTYESPVGTFLAIFTNGQKRTLSPHDTSPTAATKGITYPASFVGQLNYSDTTAEARYVSHFSAPFQMVAGGYYQDDANKYDGSTILTGSSGEIPCYTAAECEAQGMRNAGSNLSGTLNNNVLYGNATNLMIQQYGIYGQFDFKILSNLTFTAGIRYLGAHLHEQAYGVQDISGTCGWVNGCITPTYKSFDGGSYETRKTYNFALLYKPVRDVSVYARAASGFRLGGINSSHYAAASYGDDSVPLQYNSDSLWNYEGGVKVYLWNKKLYLTATYYRIDWQNQQLQAQTTTAFTYTLNAGKTVTDGMEITAQLHPIRGLDLAGALNYVDARLGSDLPAAIARAGNAGYKGDSIPYTPHWTASAQARYEFSPPNDMTPYIQGNVVWHDSSQNGFNKTDNYYVALPAYVMLDFKAGVRFGRYDVSVYSQNVTNKVAYMGVYSSMDGAKIYTSRPAMYGARLNVTF